jgi:hypothetical protein
VPRLRVGPLIVLGVLGLSLLSCKDSDEGPPCPVCPGAPPTVATLDNLWPNADSTAWTYAIEQREWPDSTGPEAYPTAEEVPPAPAIEDVRGSLWAAYVSDSVRTAEETYRLQFQGRVTTGSGARAQFLKETLYTGVNGDSVLPLPFFPERDQGRSSAFFRHLAGARPDLRAALVAKGLIAPEDDGSPGSHGGSAAALDPIRPVFFYLHGYAWEKTANHIGGYGDVNTQLSWKYLERDVSVGHEFTLRLVPDLAADVFLHARILPRRSVVTEAGRFADCVECAYLIDYGVSAITNQEGTVLGYLRNWDFASIVYAPGFGPVMSYQRMPPLGPLSGLPAGERFATDYRISLVGTNVRARNP